MKINFSRILFYLKPQIKKYLGSFVLMFATYGFGVAVSTAIVPYFYKEIVDALVSGENPDLILKRTIFLTVLTGISIILYNVFFRIGDYAMVYSQSNVMKRLHDFSFDRLLNHSYYFFSNNFSGSIVAKTKRFTRSFEVLSDVISYHIWFSFITIIGMFIVLLIKIPILAYIFLFWSILYIFITYLFIRKKVKYDAIEAEADSKVTGHLSDSILNIFNIKIFSSETQEKDNYYKITKEEEESRRKAWNYANLQNLIQAFLMAILQIGVLFMSIHLWYTGKLSVGMVVLLQTYMLKIFDTLWGLGKSMTKAFKSLTDMKEIIDIFDEPIDILDPIKPEILRINKGGIKFNNVSFSYLNGAHVFNNFSLEIKPGEKIGLVGHSGSGKTTITKLLLRFADVDNGEILIDGQNIRDITQNDLRHVISYVPQESILFHRSIKENIIYGKPGSTTEEIITVSKKAYAHEFISELPNGYDTLVGERGIKLSGGERQRIAIARAMIKNSPILMLDEATSSLDSISESYIQKAFIELMKGKTTIVIAHRLSTIQKMDRIVIFNKGVIKEMGTHDELLDKKGLYADLWNHQSGGFIKDF